MNDYFNPETQPIPEHLLRIVPAEVARREVVLPIAMEENVLVLAVDEFDEYDFDRMDRLRFVLNREVRLVPAPRVSLRFTIWKLYG